MAQNPEHLFNDQRSNYGALSNREKNPPVTIEQYMEVTGASLETAENQLGQKWYEGATAPIDPEGLNGLYY